MCKMRNIIRFKTNWTSFANYSHYSRDYFNSSNYNSNQCNKSSRDEHNYRYVKHDIKKISKPIRFHSCFWETFSVSESLNILCVRCQKYLPNHIKGLRKHRIQKPFRNFWKKMIIWLPLSPKVLTKDVCKMRLCKDYFQKIFEFYLAVIWSLSIFQASEAVAS